MYIRKTKTSSSSLGNHYSYRLVQSTRVAGKVKQKTLLNLGAQFDLEPHYWPELCQSIESKIQSNNDLFSASYPKEVKQWTEVLLLRLRPLLDARAQLEQQANDSTTTSSTDEVRVQPPINELATPWVETVTLTEQVDEDLRSVGLERIVLHSLEQLQLPSLLASLGLKPSYQKLALGLIAARMIAPDSERATFKWLENNSALKELLGISTADLKLERLYRVGDALYQHQSALESHLFQQTRDLFDLQSTIVLYDLSNTWFTTTKAGSESVQFGRGKERGTKNPVVTLALTLDEHGFPQHCELLAGNVSEPSTLKEALMSLQEVCGGTEHSTSKVPKPTVVMDAGICSENNLIWLREEGYHYITINRTKRPVPEEGADATITTSSGGAVSAWKVEQTDEQVWLVVHSEARQLKEEAILTSKMQFYEAELKYLADGLKQPKRIKQHEKVLLKLGRLNEKYKLVQRFYDIHIQAAQEGLLTESLTWSINDKYTNRSRDLGSYVLRSSRTDLDEEALVKTYLKLTDIEATFRSLKNELGMRPIYHQTDKRIAAHIWISVLSYYAVHSLRFQLKSKGINNSWDSLRKINYRVRLTTLYPNDKEEMVGYRRDTQPSPLEEELLTALGMPIDTHFKKIRHSIKV